MKSILKSAVVVAVLFSCVPGASATTLNFTFTGSNSLNCCDTSTGSGSFSFNDTSGPVSLADLTAFSFSWITDSAADFSIGLGDLTSFSLSSGTSPSATISFQSGFVDSVPSSIYFPQNFAVTGSLSNATGEVDTSNDFGIFRDDNGPVVFSLVSTVPEPITLSLFGAGLIGAAAMRRRKAKSA